MNNIIRKFYRREYSQVMKQVPKSLALAVAFTLIPLLLNYSPQGNASVTDFDPKKQFRVYISESEWFNYPTYLSLRKTNSANNQDLESVLCPKWGVGECIPQGGDFNYQYAGTIVLPLCADSNVSYCIEGLDLKSADGKWQQAKFSRHIKGPTQEPISEIGYPGGGTISLFEPRDEDKKFNVDGYAVYASFEIYPTAIKQKEPRFEALDLRITPYNLENGRFLEQTIATTVDKNGRKNLSFPSFGEKVVWSESSQRGKTADFPKDVAARISLRVPNTVTGWLGGRLSKAELSVKKLNSRTNQLVIGGYPATVGLAESVLERASAPEIFKKILADNPNSSGYGYRGSNGVFNALDAIRDSMKDRSVSEETRWSLNSYRNSTTQCLQDDSSLVGLVTTNATVFDAVPPSFSGGVLTYKIGGLHYDSKGGLTAGNYDLVMRSDVARCLYKFTNAPIQASISIAYETGERQIATKVVNEDDGWLYLGAYNFTFSSPTIQVKLFQDPPKTLPTPASSQNPTEIVAVPPSSTPKAAATKKTTITCVKGKLTKKVTAVKPKCPSGYKVKK
jgi:hypothetical protein